MTRLGVNIAHVAAQDVEAVAAGVAGLGASSARVGIAGLEDGDALRFNDMDRFVDAFARRGIAILGLLGGCAWTASRPDRAWSCPPEHGTEDRYAEYVERVAGHYAGTIDTWESWNEPEHPEYWLTGPDPARYADVVRLQHSAVKRGNPDARLLLAANGPTNLPWLGRLLRALGDDRPYDAVALHPYRFDAAPSQRSPFVLADGTSVDITRRDELVATVSMFGEPEPEVWITELGWTSGPQQSQRLLELVDLLRTDERLGCIRHLQWWNATDLGEGCGEPEKYWSFGLLGRDLRPNPIGQVFARLQPGAEL